MSKKSKNSEKNAGRRAAAEQLRRQRRSERRRTTTIVLACGVVGLVIIGLGAYPVVKDALAQNELEGQSLDSIGASPSAAGCRKAQTRPAKGNNDHRQPGARIRYQEAPPAFGPHYAVPATISRKFYTAQDRPPVEKLVHNLEHGYTVLWYDETVAGDDQQVSELKGIAKKFPSETDPEDKFIVAPWTSQDGADFPDGAHVALTHWSAGGVGAQRKPGNQVGVWRYCDAPSGDAVARFVKDYPYVDSPEPRGQ